MAFSSVVASGCERMWLHTTWFDNISSCQGWSGWFGSMKPLTAEIHSWSHAFQQQMRASFFERCFWPKICLYCLFAFLYIFSENTHEYSAKPWTSSHQAASTNYNYNQVLLRTHCIYGTFVQVPVFTSIICTPFSSIFCKRRGFMRTPAPKQHSPRPQRQSLAAMPILQRIWLISKHAHEVKATENRIREIHILWEGPAFCGLPFNGFGGDFSRIAGMQCKFSLSFLWEHIMT